MEEKKEYYLMVKGEKVAVTEEVYRAYKSAYRREKKQKQRMWRCRVAREKGGKVFMKRCTKNCKDCEYAKSGKANGSVLSWEWLKEVGYDEPDPKQDVEKNYIAEEEKAELYKAISRLTPRQQEVVGLIYFDGKTEQEVADYYGVTHQAIHNAKQKIETALRKILSEK